MQKVKQKIREKVRDWVKQRGGEVLEIPVQESPVDQPSDLGMPAFALAKVVGKSPTEVAEELVRDIEWGEEFEKVESVGPFVNFTLGEKVWQEVVGEVGKVEQSKEKQKIVVDYGGENVAKPQSVGHLRSSILGQAFVNCGRELGHEVVGDNHLGDWGAQFGKLLAALAVREAKTKDEDLYKINNQRIRDLWFQLKSEKEKEFDDKKSKVGASLITALLKLYVGIHEEIKKNQKKGEEYVKFGREKFKELSEGDEYLTEVWEDMVDITIENLKRVYERLGVEFDHFLGESYYRGEKMERVGRECEKLDYLEKNEDGSWAVVPPEETKLPSFLIKKADGATLYHTSDLAAIWHRINEWNADRIVYFVAEPQSLHFRQLFWLVEQLGWGETTKLEHASFGLVRLPEGKMSTRQGNIVRLEELLNEARERAKKVIDEKRGDLEEKEREKLAEQIGVGAVIYEDLYKDRTKHVVFDWDEALSFEGQSGPYVQYAHARACAILRKAEDAGIKNAEMQKITEQGEKELIKKMVQMEEAIERVVKEAKPSYLAQWVYELASEFNSFYAHVPVMNVEDEEVKKSRVALVQAVQKCLEKGLNLLGLAAPERM